MIDPHSIERSMPSLLRLLPLAFAVVPFIALGAQRPFPPEHRWLSGGAAYTRTALDLGDTNAVRNGYSIRLGARACASCLWNSERISVTPSIAFGATDVRGLDVGRHPFAFSRLDVGVQLAARVAKYLRPYVSTWLKNSRSAERVDPDGLLRNYSGSNGAATTAGIEFPWTAEGRGPDVSMTWLSGRFTKTESRGFGSPAAVEYRGWALTIGWSGPFSGSGLPWR